MTPKNIALAIVAVACVAGAVAVTLMTRGGGAGDESLDRPTMWVCRDEQCTHEFIITLGSMSQQQGADLTGRVECPECGSKDTARAMPCHSCARHLELWGHGQLPPLCPHCGHETDDHAHGPDTHVHGPMTPPLDEDP